MNETWTTTYNRFFELANATYTSWVNALVWGAERTLELNKTLVAQLEVSQAQSRKYIEDINEKNRQAVQLLQETVQNGLKTYSNNVNNLRTATESSVADINRKLDDLQQQTQSELVIATN